MDSEQTAKPENDETQPVPDPLSPREFALSRNAPSYAETQPLHDAPSTRAAALRKELFGSALSLDEAAYILSLDRTTVAKYLRERSLFGFQIGREWLIPEEELRAYVSRVYRTAAQGGPEEREAHPTGDEIAPRSLEAGQRNLLGKLFPRGKEREKSGSPDRFNKFSFSARQVLALAQEEATRFDHNYIGTEHLLLGLIREDEGVAAIVLSNLVVDLQDVRAAVERIVGRGDRPVVGEVGLTPRSKKVIELAVEEARRLSHPQVGTEHLLLGLVREGDGIAAGVLESMGVTAERVRTQIAQVLTQRGALVHGSPPAVPAEATALVSEGDPGRPCPHCSAVSPAYFRYCFNCGEHLQGDAQATVAS